MFLFDTGGKPKGKVEMVEIDELSLKQAHRYVRLHINGIDFYRKLVNFIALSKKGINFVWYLPA